MTRTTASLDAIAWFDGHPDAEPARCELVLADPFLQISPVGYDRPDAPIVADLLSASQIGEQP